MTFFDQVPTRADAKDGGTAKTQTASTFADEIGKALGGPTVNPDVNKAKPQDAKTAGADTSPKPASKGPVADSKGKTPDVPRPVPNGSKLGRSTSRPNLNNYFSIPEDSSTRPEVLIPSVKPPERKDPDLKPPVGKAPDASPKVTPKVETNPVVPKAPEPKNLGLPPANPPAAGEVKPLLPRPGLPSSGDLRLPGLSRDRLLGKEPPKPLFVPTEPVRPSTTVIVPKRDTTKPPVSADTPKPPAAVDRPKPPPVVNTGRPPIVIDTKKPPTVDIPKRPIVAPLAVPDNPYKPLPKVDYDKQKEGGVDATRTTPDGAPPKYPGPAIDQDKWIMKKLLKPTKLGSALYDLYLATATDRSEENKVPDGIKIAELHKGIKEKVASIELLGDSEMFQTDRHGIVLHPTGRKHPGNFYAVLRDDNGIPINVIEYSKTGGNGKPKYLQQWILDREADPATGGRKTTISYFRESSSTAMGRPGIENKTMADVYMGRTEYLAGADGGILKATQFNNLNKPTIEIDYSPRTPTMQIRDPNSGRMTNAVYSRAFTTNMAFSGVYLK